MMKKVLLCFCVVAFWACTQNFDEGDLVDVPQEQTTAVSQTQEEMGNPIVLGEKLNNPYSLKNMQGAYDSIQKKSSMRRVGALKLEPTHYYVRFLPKDTADFNKLWRDSLELFDYPLDYEVESWGDYYHDPSIPEDQPTWQYTKVPVGYKFPEVQYEILDECFIPEDEDECEDESEDVKVKMRKAKRMVDLGDLERMAFIVSGNEDMLEPTNNTPEGMKKALKKRPSGTFRVYNNTTGQWEGVAGVRLRITNLLKWFNVQTDENGYYSTSKYFLVKKVHYAMIFENAKGFNIGSRCVIANARVHEMGWHSSKGYNYDFWTTSSMWSHCVVNNSAYYMYKNFKDYMPNNMVLWVVNNTSTGCAAMLHHATAVHWKKFVNVVTLGVINLFIIVCLAPDIIVGAKGKSYYDLCETTCHELSHAMHFKKVGIDYWDKYIDGILYCWMKSSNNIYGTSSTTYEYSGHIGVGETFGYAMGYYMADKKCNRNWGAYKNDEYWFKWRKSYDILYIGKLTPLQFLDCMDSNTTNLTKLGTNLHKKNSNISSNLYTK